MRITYPRPPMVVPYIKKEEPKINNTGTKLTITPQNDQRSDNSPKSDNHPDSVNPLKDKNAEAPQKEIIKPTEKSPKNESKKLEAKSQEIDEGNDAKGLAGLNEVLEGLDITIEDLHQVLKRVRIPMETFLEFIDREKTKDEIMEYLNLPESLKPNFRRTNGFSSDVYRTTKTIPYSTSGTYDHKYNRVDRQKELVDHLPITEIVHEVPMNSQVTYKDPVQHKSQNDKYPPKKNYKIASENEFVEKKYKSKRYKPNHSEKNPYLMNSDISTLFPPKDSPITTSFWPPKKKATKPAEAVKSRASIVSLTIEERIADDSSKILHETTLPIRNKVFRTDSEMSTSFPKSSKNRNQSSYEQQQANIDDILPVRGVLMFGGVFAIVGLLIIGAFIIHGTVKYNRKPSSSTYELNEHQDGSTSSVLSNT
ncbi:hypothetical protein Avbf_03276 [Armadillidium vulgare]|nr:hypothetical protein Avbf_03276 [Armadillidium vulgare]